MAAYATCPFCAMHCDDLDADALATTLRRPDVDAAALNAAGVRCPRGVRGFRLAVQTVSAEHAGARVAGKHCSVEEAVAAAVKLLGQSQSPLVSGLVGDVTAVRSALRVAERIGAITDHLRFGARWRLARVVQEHGGVMTTFAEVRNRADLLVFIGNDPLREWPRAVERLFPESRALFLKGPRRFARLGGRPDEQSPDHRGTSAGAAVRFDLAVDADDDALVDLIGSLALRLRTPPPKAGSAADASTPAAPAGIAPTPNLDEIVGAIRSAQYPVFVWDASALDPDAGQALNLRLMHLISTLNDTQRAAAFPIGGADLEPTAEAVHLWTTGYPSRTRLGGAAAWYDPTHFDTQRLIDRKEVDAVLWLSALDRSSRPPALPRGIRSIVLGHPLMYEDGKDLPDVFIPVRVPGVHQTGQVFRADRVVSLPLRALVSSDLPRADQVLARIGDGLGAVPEATAVQWIGSAQQAAPDATPGSDSPKESSC